MAGRNSRPQRPKQERRGDRGYQAPNREGGPSWGTGRGRNKKGVRERDWTRRHNDDLQDVVLQERVIGFQIILIDIFSLEFI